MGREPNSKAKVACSHVTGAQMSLCVLSSVKDRFLYSCRKQLAAICTKLEVLGIQRLKESSLIHAWGKRHLDVIHVV